MLKNIFINCRIIIASQKRLHKPKNYYPPTENKEECITWKKPVKKDNYWLALDFLKRFPGCPAGIKFFHKNAEDSGLGRSPGEEIGYPL